HAVLRAGIEPDRIEDAVIGSVLNAGTAGGNVARHGVLAAGLPASVAAQTLDRQCASGLMAIATAAKQIMCDGMEVVVAGGQENISAVQTRYFEWTRADQDPNVLAVQPAAYMPMLETAEFVSRKYGISRDVQD
ncbi:beta-ketoacyl synthase N-terminal-like domain-containing protein, partial [Priestia koreensis]|uniref:thiolase family protein n=2 Tax=Bacteria TaxID=2 RepID=UPI003340B7D2|nr:acetyl-CoA C-acyltransferase [Priestia koreensis]